MPGACTSRRRWWSCAIGPLPSIGVPSAFDDAAEQRVADDDREDATRRGDGHALLDAFGVTEHDRADRLLFEVEREAERSPFELEELVHGRVGQSGDARDAVTDFEHPTDALAVDRRVEPLDLLAERGSDLRRVDGELGHDYWSLLFAPSGPSACRAPLRSI